MYDRVLFEFKRQWGQGTNQMQGMFETEAHALPQITLRPNSYTRENAIS